MGHYDLKDKKDIAVLICAVFSALLCLVKLFDHYKTEVRMIVKWMKNHEYLSRNLYYCLSVSGAGILYCTILILMVYMLFNKKINMAGCLIAGLFCSLAFNNAGYITEGVAYLFSDRKTDAAFFVMHFVSTPFYLCVNLIIAGMLMYSMFNRKKSYMLVFIMIAPASLGVGSQFIEQFLDPSKFYYFARDVIMSVLRLAIAVSGIWMLEERKDGTLPVKKLSDMLK